MKHTHKKPSISSRRELRLQALECILSLVGTEMDAIVDGDTFDYLEAEDDRDVVWQAMNEVYAAIETFIKSGKV